MRRAAAVIFGAHEPSAHCVIWDMSDGGARLTVARPIATLPHTFTLALAATRNGSIKRKCEVVWTDARYIGVKFV
jgi:hypothetical protein